MIRPIRLTDKDAGALEALVVREIRAELAECYGHDWERRVDHPYDPIPVAQWPARARVLVRIRRKIRGARS